MMRRACVVGCLLSLVGGCSTRKNPLACQDGVCIDPDIPYCDSEGLVEGTPNTCVALACTPGELIGCLHDGSALTCNASGDDTNVTACSLGCDPTSGCIGIACMGDDLVTPAGTETCTAGCVASPMPHCKHIVPRYLPDVCDVPAEMTELVFASSGVFDTNLDANCTGGVVAQTAGPSICVVHYGSIRIDAGTELQVVGDRALALVGDHEVVIRGVLDISARTGVIVGDSPQLVNGPGGGASTSGGSVSSFPAGGGAGFKTPGGAGGNATLDGGAANAGASSNPLTSAILVGGPRSGGVGGGGGGATLIACHDTVDVSGTIDAAGAGGAGGFFFLSLLGGSGGGAGGYVVLQGIRVDVHGEVYANGGAGGGGGVPGIAFGANGEGGTRSETVAARGGTSNHGEGAGGDGGCLATQPRNGTHPTAAGTKPGGGGGSMGFFQSFTPSAADAVLAPSHASPRFEPPGTVPTR